MKTDKNISALKRTKRRLEAELSTVEAQIVESEKPLKATKAQEKEAKSLDALASILIEIKARGEMCRADMLSTFGFAMTHGALNMAGSLKLLESEYKRNATPADNKYFRLQRLPDRLLKAVETKDKSTVRTALSDAITEWRKAREHLTSRVKSVLDLTSALAVKVRKAL